MQAPAVVPAAAATPHFHTRPPQRVDRHLKGSYSQDRTRFHQQQPHHFPNASPCVLLQGSYQQHVVPAATPHFHRAHLNTWTAISCVILQGPYQQQQQLLAQASVNSKTAFTTPHADRDLLVRTSRDQTWFHPQQPHHNPNARPCVLLQGSYQQQQLQAQVSFRQLQIQQQASCP
eukprot:TRINITY_DN24645_c0_g1_i1.p2 TRINITY_DN24645_c0_g1~~TRINITY_DN24645_c0_g1_i1.p2  ORF type:complete len:175 (+),score=16.61 TRINITY_DN24645_c0_g1_i1:525-1049(+)